jgi:hypothetical protein
MRSRMTSGAPISRGRLVRSAHAVQGSCSVGSIPHIAKSLHREHRISVRSLMMMSCLLATGVALAENEAGVPQSSDRNAAFERLDRNQDGLISRREAASDREIEKRFARFDANKDKLLSPAEFQQAKQEQEQRFLADASVTTKVKSALLLEKGVPSTAISVTTSDGVVQLSGSLPRPEQIALAGRVTSRVSGVKTVQNELKVTREGGRSFASRGPAAPAYGEPDPTVLAQLRALLRGRTGGT